MGHPKLWFSTYFGEYNGNEPSFYTAKEIDLAAHLEHNYAAIEQEVKMVWADDNDTMDKYGDYTAYDDVQFPPGGWKKLVFKAWALENKFMCRKFPVTAQLLKQFPSITSCFIIKLSRHTVLRLHHGETNATYRVHLGLKVPAGGVETCGFEVNGQSIQWQAGKAFGFIDAYNHKAWNNSDEDRYVLLVDIMRDEFKGRKNYVCVKVIFSHIISAIGRRFGVHGLYKKELGFKQLFFWILYIPILAGIRIHNRFGLVKL